jgi:hypothetical protein
MHFALQVNCEETRGSVKLRRLSLRDLAVGTGRGGGIQKNVEVVRVNRAEERVFPLDVPLANQIDKRVFEAEGAFLFGEGDFLVKMLEGVSPNMVACAVTDQEQLGCGNAAAAFFG